MKKILVDQAKIKPYMDNPSCSNHANAVHRLIPPKAPSLLLLQETVHCAKNVCFCSVFIAYTIVIYS